MRIIIIVLLIVFCGPQLFSRKDLPVKETLIEKKLEDAHKLIRQQQEKLIAHALQVELDKIKHIREIKLLKLEIECLRDRGNKFGFLSFVLACFSLYMVRKLHSI